MSVSNVSVAMIDDDNLYRQLLIRKFNSVGIVVIFQAENGKLAIKQMQTSLVLPMIVVLDIEMPLMNGYETARHIKMNWPQVVIIGHSSLSEDSAGALMIEAGADIFLPKPCIAKELIFSIKQLILFKF